jgi:hypothetical protein
MDRMMLCGNGTPCFDVSGSVALQAMSWRKAAALMKQMASSIET